MVTLLSANVNAGSPAAATDYNRIVTDLGSLNAGKIGSVPTDVTASRATNGTVYQNTTGKAIIVAVSLSGATSSGGSTSADAKIGTANPPTILVGRYTQGGNAGPTTQGGQLVFIVPNNYYYSVNGFTLVSWIEYTA